MCCDNSEAVSVHCNYTAVRSNVVVLAPSFDKGIFRFYFGTAPPDYIIGVEGKIPFYSYCTQLGGVQQVKIQEQL